MPHACLVYPRREWLRSHGRLPTERSPCAQPQPPAGRRTASDDGSAGSSALWIRRSSAPRCVSRLSASTTCRAQSVGAAPADRGPELTSLIACT